MDTPTILQAEEGNSASNQSSEFQTGYIFTQLSIPTHAQLRHRLKFIKNHLKTPTCFGLRPSSGSYNVLAKITIILTTLRCMLSVVMWQHVVYFVSGCT